MATERWAQRKAWLWLADHHETVAADVHSRHHGLDWYTLDAYTALRLARLMLDTPGTYTHSTVTLPERENQLIEAGLARRIDAVTDAVRVQGVGQASTDENTGSARGFEVRDLGGGTSRQPRDEVPLDDRWRKLADMNGVNVDD